MPFQSVGSGAYPSNAVDNLRADLVELIREKLTPVALKYGYSSSPLEDKIKWRPIVLILGNYSSGKSTLINELLGFDLQKTGQAPTDDSFTVISYRDLPGPVEERDGMVLLNDPQYPFAQLKQQGQRFASHFRLKQVHASILENVSLIDTPGMLDSVAEKDRGYNYQEVIAELASIADLILILFDPHKAGTVRETYESLRQTLPKATYDNRMLFVLNRIDECANLHDFLRVYGTLCWNLSQMTGRKDIPPIFLTHSEYQGVGAADRPAFLSLLDNQRQELEEAILKAPKYRLDHLSTYIESHCERLSHFLEALQEYGSLRRHLIIRIVMISLAVSLLSGTLVYGALLLTLTEYNLTPEFSMLIAGIVAALTLGLAFVLVYPGILRRFHQASLDSVHTLTKLDHKNRQESWEQVEPLVRDYLSEKNGRFSLHAVRRDARQIKRAAELGARETGQALAT